MPNDVGHVLVFTAKWFLLLRVVYMWHCVGEMKAVSKQIIGLYRCIHSHDVDYDLRRFDEIFRRQISAHQLLAEEKGIMPSLLSITYFLWTYFGGGTLSFHKKGIPKRRELFLLTTSNKSHWPSL
ncbi:hypothetical protein HDV63DRAFT_6628 [Trichoderma sp. SZMC 28014]